MTTTSSLFKNLITKSMNTKQLSKITCAIMLLFSMIACKKEGPVTIDNIKPNLTFEISGIRTFNSDTDYTSLGNLYLEPGKNYNFNAAINDTGGVKRLQVSIDTFLRVSNVISVPNNTASYAYVLGLIHRVYTINGMESDPFTRFVFSGKIVPNTYIPNQQEKAAFIYCNGDDYNQSNNTRIIIPCIITNQPPNGYGWKRF